jgi:hypothetical protein
MKFSEIVLPCCRKPISTQRRPELVQLLLRQPFRQKSNKFVKKKYQIERENYKVGGLDVESNRDRDRERPSCRD